MMKNLALCLTVLCLLGSPAFANVDEAGAATLKSMFENLIDFQKSSMSISDRGRLQTDGEVSVEPSGAYYAVTFPYMKVMMPDDSRFEIGIISINAVPHLNDGEWKMTVALPTPMIMFDKDGVPKTRIAIGQQQAAGIWSEKLQNFYKLDATYQNITASSDIDTATLSLPKTTIRYDFDFDANDALSGSGTVTSSGLLAKFKDDDSAIEIGEGKAKFEIDRFNIDAMNNYREKVKTLAEHNSDVADNPERLEGVYNMMYDLLLTSSNGFKSNYSLKDLKINSSNQTDSFSVTDINFGLDLMGFLEDAVDLSFRVGGQEIKPKFSQKDVETIVPHNLKLDWQLRDIPFKQLADLGKNTAIASINQPNMAGIGMFSLIVKIPALMAQAGTQLEIKDNYIAGPDFKITLDGLAKADISAANSMSVDAMARFEGLNILLGRLENLSETIDDDQDREDLQESIAQLKAIKKIGTPDDATSDNPTYSFRFEVLPNGKIQMNGRDFFKVMKEYNAPEEDVTPPVQQNDSKDNQE